MVKSERREPEAASDRASAARKQREMNLVLGSVFPFLWLSTPLIFTVVFETVSIEARLTDLTWLIGYLLPTCLC